MCARMSGLTAIFVLTATLAVAIAADPAPLPAPPAAAGVAPVDLLVPVAAGPRPLQTPPRGTADNTAAPATPVPTGAASDYVVEGSDACLDAGAKEASNAAWVRACARAGMGAGAGVGGKDCMPSACEALACMARRAAPRGQAAQPPPNRRAAPKPPPSPTTAARPSRPAPRHCRPQLACRNARAACRGPGGIVVKAKAKQAAAGAAPKLGGAATLEQCSKIAMLSCSEVRRPARALHRRTNACAVPRYIR